MLAAHWLLTVSMIGVDVGWRPTAAGSLEYIIQIEPEMLERLEAGHEITSTIPPALRGVRQYRIKVGTEPLPQEGTPPAPVTDTPTTDLPAGENANAPRELGSGPELPSMDSRELADHQEPAVPPSAPPTRFDPEVRPAVGLLHAGERAATRAAEPGALAPADEVNSAPAPKTPSTYQPLAPAHQQPSAPTGRFWTAALLGLFASLGGNVFMGWVSWSQRSRHRRLVKQWHDATQKSRHLDE